MQKILIVEDESVIRVALRRLLERNGYQISEAGSVQAAEKEYNLADFDLVISDLRLPGAPGTDLIKKAGDVPVLIMTSYASLRSAVDSMRMGAVDYIAKPFDHGDMVSAVQRIIADHPTAHADASTSHAAPVKSAAGIVGNCPAIRVLFEHIERMAPTDSTVLVLGETGTGKELVARSVHQNSLRADKILVSVNCAAIPDTLIESELFGYEKGAFTGADRRKPGLMEAAAGGTLFLDEIGDIGPAIQAKLLRVLETGRFRRVGATSDMRADVRIVAATNRDLATLVRAGTFRADLYYRLNAFILAVPPLRQRREDIPVLANHFLAARAGGVRQHLHPEAVRFLTEYDWPGNVRELRNVIERASILSGDTPEIAPAHLLGLSGDMPSGAVGSGNSVRFDDEPALEKIEREYLAYLLDKYQGNRRKVAEKLGISERTCYRMTARYDLG